MNASNMGVSAPNPLQALARLLPAGKPSHSIPLATPTRSAKTLHIVASESGLIAYRNGAPLAWIVPGYHQDRTDYANPTRCDFVDVAYLRKTRQGINLETRDFATLEESITFINGVFGGAA